MTNILHFDTLSVSVNNMYISQYFTIQALSVVVLLHGDHIIQIKSSWLC